MGDRKGVIVVGASNTDLIAYCDRFPQVGETYKGTSFSIGFGGKGANQAVQAAKLGARVSMITKLGEDVFGKDTLRNFQSQGIDTTHVLLTSEASSGVAPITVDSHGNNSILIIGGANDLLTPSDIQKAKEHIATHQVLIAQLEIPVPTTLEALKVAREVGVTTILNTAPVPETGIPEALFEFTDILCANETEAQMLAEKAGKKIIIETVEDATEAARVVANHFKLKDIIITLGEKGSLWYNTKSNTATHGEAGKVEKVIDTTGAGDSFIGSLSVFLLKLGALDNEDARKEALKRANAVAAISVQAKGTQSSYPSKEHPGIPKEWIE